MKKIVVLFLSALIFCTITSKADASNYGEYNSFDQLYAEYHLAVETNDIEKQEELLKIAQESLDKEIAESKLFQNFRADPDEAYYKQLFPNYFKSGYWENRENGICLTLNTLSRLDPTFWTSTDKANAWNATFAKFYNSVNWDNTSSMEEQFYCHARLGYSFIESEWNLEPWRTEVNPITCN